MRYFRRSPNISLLCSCQYWFSNLLHCCHRTEHISQGKCEHAATLKLLSAKEMRSLRRSPPM